MTRTPWTTLPTDDETDRWDAVADETGRLLATDALARDRANAEPAAELKLLKDSGLANLLIPRQFGGHGATGRPGCGRCGSSPGTTRRSRRS